MKFRKGDIVVITGNECHEKLLRTWDKSDWATVIGKIGLVLGKWYGDIEVLHKYYDFDDGNPAGYVYHPSELTKVDHINEHDWPGLDLLGFGANHD